MELREKKKKAGISMGTKGSKRSQKQLGENRITPSHLPTTPFPVELNMPFRDHRSISSCDTAGGKDGKRGELRRASKDGAKSLMPNGGV